MDTVVRQEGGTILPMSSVKGSAEGKTEFGKDDWLNVDSHYPAGSSNNSHVIMV